jgi:hypothetical protein
MRSIRADSTEVLGIGALGCPRLGRARLARRAQARQPSATAGHNRSCPGAKPLGGRVELIAMFGGQDDGEATGPRTTLVLTVNWTVWDPANVLGTLAGSSGASPDGDGCRIPEFHQRPSQVPHPRGPAYCTHAPRAFVNHEPALHASVMCPEWLQRASAATLRASTEHSTISRLLKGARQPPTRPSSRCTGSWKASVRPATTARTTRPGYPPLCAHACTRPSTTETNVCRDVRDPRFGEH